MSVTRRRTSVSLRNCATASSSSNQTSRAAPEAKTAGAILRVRLKHFMCHDHLDVQLNERVNFVIGPNGSGKSAILTGIMVALGCRARATDRASTIKALIQVGRPSALVSVTLSNEGAFSYKPHVYGTTVTVERSISAAGASTYSLKDSTGKVVSKSGHELAMLLESMNVQVDNPVAVLTQETSKNFLRAHDPERKYRLFMRATCLEQIKHNYGQTEKSIELATLRLSEKQKNLPLVRNNVEQLERRLNRLKNMHRLEAQLQLLQQQVLWAKVVESEAKLASDQAEHDQCQLLIDAVKQQQHKFLAEKEQQKTTVRELEQRLSTTSAQLKQQQQQHNQCLTAYSAAKQQLSEALAATSSAAAVVAARRQDRDNLQREIERVRNIDYPGLAERRQQLHGAVQAAGEQVEQLIGVESARNTQLQHVTATVGRLQEDVYRAQAQHSQQQRLVAGLESEIGRLRNSARDQNAVFGAWVADVQRAVSQAISSGQFRVAPIGPLGAHIKIRAGAEKWAPLVETCLSGLLSSYLVDNYDDQMVMAQILRTVLKHERQKPQIICSKFLDKVHDVRRHGIDTAGGGGEGGEGGSCHVSVWSVLDIECVPVANAVIDNSSVESILLLDSDRQARHVMSNKDQVPRGCRQAYTLAGYQYFPDPSYRTYPVRVQARARYLHTSVDQALRHLEEDLTARREQLEATSRQLSVANAALSEQLSAQRQLVKQLAETGRQLLAARQKLRQLQSEEVPEPMDLQSLEDDVAAMNGALEEAEAATAPLVEREREARRLCDEARAAVQASRQQSQQFVDATLQPLSQELDSAKSRMSRLETALLRHQQKLEQLQQQLADRLQLVEEAQKAVQQLTAAAAAAGADRLEVTSSSVRLERQLAGLRRSLHEGREAAAAGSGGGGSEQEQQATVEQQLQTARDEYRRMSDEFGVISGELDALREMVAARQRRFVTLRLALAHRLAHHFVLNLEARRYKGRLTFDHAAGLLSLTVSPRQADANCSEKNPQQLSGGERSFSTLAFILALWEIIESPFRMLDEFDVFMDEVNRKIGHDILVSSALSSPNQFVFITPLTLPSVTNNDNVTVHKLQPPQR